MSSAVEVIDELDPLVPEHRLNPYPLWRRMRETDPVHWSDVNGLWWISRHADVLQIYSRDGKDVTSTGISRPNARGLKPSKPTRWTPTVPEEAVADRAASDAIGTWKENMQVKDPPDHTRLRRLVQQGFSAKTVRQLGIQVQAIADELLDVVPRSRGGMDVVSDFTARLPPLVVASILGVGPEHNDFFAEVARLRVVCIDAFPDPNEVARWDAYRPRFEAIVREAVERRRKHPGEDVVSQLILAESDSDRLTESEVLGTCYVMMDAGAVTTTQLIGNAIHLLIENPEQLEVLKNTPDLIHTAVDEFLRYAPPGAYGWRVALRDFELGGKQIGAGEGMLLMKAATNRDPEVFDHPDELRLDRHPNPHVAFGRGMHYCIGAPLAKLEAEIALRTFFDRYPRPRLAGTPERYPIYTSRSFRRLPVAFD